MTDRSTPTTSEPTTEWWKVVITAHATTIPPERGQLGTSHTLCGRAFYEQAGGASVMRLGQDTLFYPRCKRCQAAVAKREEPTDAHL